MRYILFAYLASPFVAMLAAEFGYWREGRRPAPWYVLAYLVGGVVLAAVGAVAAP